MGEPIALTASDGFVLDAYRADPPGPPRGGLVVVQEIFGVNPHIRSVADGYAAQGYCVIAPALFDRARKGVELGYDPPGIAEGSSLARSIPPADTLKDVAAAVDALKAAGHVGVVGYCWGGTLAFAAALDLPVSAAVGYYGGGIAGLLDRTPAVPTMLHFGEHDHHIPMSDVEKIRAAEPSVQVFTYAAGHGFNCDARGSYDKASAELALSRSLPFLREHVG